MTFNRRYFSMHFPNHDYVMQWKHFPHYRPIIVRGMHWPPADSPLKGPWRGAFDFFFDLYLNKRLCKQLRHWWFETSSRWLGRHCNYLNCTDVCSKGLEETNMCWVMTWHRTATNKLLLDLATISMARRKTVLMFGHTNVLIKPQFGSQTRNFSMVI